MKTIKKILIYATICLISIFLQKPFLIQGDNKLVLKKTCISQIKFDESGLYVKVKKRNVAGYQYRYSFTKDFKDCVTKNSKKNKIRFYNVNSDTDIYLKVRTYVIKNGKKKYSGWSKPLLFNTSDISKVKTYNIQNAIVNEFVSLPDYDGNDYSYSYVPELAQDGYDKPEKLVFEWGLLNCNELKLTVKDITESDKNTYILDPADTGIDMTTMLYPGRKYTVELRAYYADYTFIVFHQAIDVVGTVRMIEADGAFNIRDIGGWKCGDNGRIRYGLIYRGSMLDNLTDKGKKTLEDDIGIKTEIDLQGTFDERKSVIGEGVLCYGITGKSYLSGFEYPVSTRKVFNRIIYSLSRNMPVYIHCWGGCDRTEFYICLLGCFLGMSESDICKEFELSSFTYSSNTNNYRRYRSMGSDANLVDKDIRNFEGMINKIKSFDGNNLQEKAKGYLLSVGVKEEDLVKLKEIMLEDDGQ